MNILITAAHPDDEVLGCGGTIARMTAAGNKVFIAILGEGITSRYKQREEADQFLLESLRERSHRVKCLLGAADLFMFDLPDNRFDTVPLLDITKLVEELIDKVRPDIVYTHHAGDLNMDHVITHRAVLTATRPAASCLVKTMYAYEVPSSTDWGFSQFHPVFRPNAFVDISSTLERKIEAMQIYDGEVRPFPHPRSAEALRAIVHARGSSIGATAAEAFELIRSIR
jgi:LmbE family N-acetylglucosaminyl deacetylase